MQALKPEKTLNHLSQNIYAKTYSSILYGFYGHLRFSFFTFICIGQLLIFIVSVFPLFPITLGLELYNKKF